MKDLEATFVHEKRRFLDHIVADIDDQIGRRSRIVDGVVVRKRRGAHVAGMSLVDHALAHLGADERNAGQFDELFEHVARALAVRACPDEQQWILRLFDHLDGLGDGFGLGCRATRSLGIE